MLTLFLPALVAACIFVTGLYLQEWFERPCRILKPKRPPTPVNQYRDRATPGQNAQARVEPSPSLPLPRGYLELSLIRR